MDVSAFVQWLHDSLAGAVTAASPPIHDQRLTANPFIARRRHRRKPASLRNVVLVRLEANLGRPLHCNLHPAPLDGGEQVVLLDRLLAVARQLCLVLPQQPLRLRLHPVKVRIVEPANVQRKLGGGVHIDFCRFHETVPLHRLE